MPDVYTPSEDSFLLAEQASTLKVQNVLEIGVGSGFVSSVLAESNELVVGTELSRAAAKEAKSYLKDKGNVEIIVCDKASVFRPKVFDAVVFNPPYLPSDEGCDQTIDGGKDGIEASEAWMEEAVRVLKEEGEIIFITSSLSQYQRLLDRLNLWGFEASIVKRSRLFFEELMVIRAKRCGPRLCRHPVG